MGAGMSPIRIRQSIVSLVLILPQHEYLLGLWGVPIGEMFDLEVGSYAILRRGRADVEHLGLGQTVQGEEEVVLFLYEHAH